MKRKKFIPLVALFFIPSIVLANAGSPMMWFGVFHCLILNSFIGLFESYYLTKREVANRWWLIILGNYVSMFIGYWFIAPCFSEMVGNSDFWGGQTNYGSYELHGFFVGMSVLFFATLLLEFPFFYWAIKNKLALRSGVVSFLKANLLTNIILFVIYFLIVFKGSA